MKKLIAATILVLTLGTAAPAAATILPPGWPYSLDPCVRAVLAHGGTLKHAFDVCDVRPIIVYKFGRLYGN